jgi:hypothetical protein
MHGSCMLVYDRKILTLQLAMLLSYLSFLQASDGYGDH